MTASPNPATRHLVSINDLSDAEIETVFQIAQSYLDMLPDAHFRYRIGRSTNLAAQHILASLFYEPSTRTRLSFESAMLRLGGDVITSADPATSSAAKGESLADSVRVIANYADVIVIRHPRDGAARLAAEYSPIPVINGGDGAHEHPTQTLCDIFTLFQKSPTLRHRNIAISGDLRGSRTIHSFVYALARFGANIMTMPAPGMGLPAHVDSRLREEFGCRIASKASYQNENASVDALYVTPDEPHQLSLRPDIDAEVSVEIQNKVDAVYVTRFQKERWADKDQSYPRIDAQFLQGSKYAEASVLHPLPRVGELDISFDADDRAVYFQQAAYGVPIRMALISLLLGVARAPAFATFPGGFRGGRHATYRQPMGTGIHCANPNCIVQDAMEAQYASNAFHIVGTENGRQARLRCFYCESDIEHFVTADRATGRFSADQQTLKAVLAEADPAVAQQRLADIVLFDSENAARTAGFEAAPPS
ncbi:MAG TPA: hypothetical protein VNQ99_05120 [Xanthobacteraceae bacterium]|nr:hypothetical protein [Xanthobacteraceae bacterium]